MNPAPGKNKALSNSTYIFGLPNYIGGIGVCMCKKRLWKWFFIITAGIIGLSCSTFVYLNKGQNKDLLQPPRGITFASDKFIEHLNSKDQLKYFDKSGQWHSQEEGLLNWIVGQSSGEYIKLVSIQKLASDKNGTFKLDCILSEGEELGLFYGEYALVVSPQVITLVEIDFKSPNIIRKILDKKPVSAIDYSLPITFSISKGFTLGTEKPVSSIYANGQGFIIPEQVQGVNVGFGLFFKGDNPVKVGRFRWFRGGT